MTAFSRWMWPAAFFVLTVVLVTKGMELRSMGTNVDGAGIGIHLLGLEINDTVPEESIPSYALRFFAAGVLAFSAGLFFVKKALKHPGSPDAEKS